MFLHMVVSVCVTGIWPILLGGEGGEVISNLIKALHKKKQTKSLLS